MLVFSITILKDIQRKKPKKLKIVGLKVKKKVKNPYVIKHLFNWYSLKKSKVIAQKGITKNRHFESQF